MSQASDAGLIAEYSTYLVDDFTAKATAALAVYEYVITIKQEMAVIWLRKWTLATWIFMANRYLLVAIVIWNLAPTTSQMCPAGLIMGDILYISQLVVFAAFSALRVFALWDGNIPTTLLVSLLNLVPAAMNIYIFTQETPVFVSDSLLGSYCADVLNLSPTATFHGTLGTRLSVIAADVVVIAITWHKTFGNAREAAMLGVRTPLSILLLRDGTIYFVALLLMNIAQILVDAFPSLQNISPIGTILPILEPILISRFMLNLRKVGEPENEHYDDAGSRSLGVGFRLPSFASIAGNMGEDLDHGPEEEVFDVVEDNVCIVQAEAAAIPVAVVEYRASQDNTASENCEI